MSTPVRALYSLVSFLVILAPSISLAAGRVELLLGARFPNEDNLYTQTRHSTQPALGIEAAVHPRSWPVGITAYAAGAADWYKGETLRYPGFPDWLTADYRSLYGAVGGGLEKAWRRGPTRISAAGGLMASTNVTRVTRDEWSETGSERTTGQWVGASVSRAISGPLGIGVRARYTWEKYTAPGADWRKAGGLQLGLTLGFGPPRG